MKFIERLNVLGRKLEKQLFGPTPKDKEYLDEEPTNLARERMEVAKMIASITSKEDALRVLNNAIVAGRSDYAARERVHHAVASKAEEKAREYGASDTEIAKVRNNATDFGNAVDSIRNNRM